MSKLNIGKIFAQKGKHLIRLELKYSMLTLDIEECENLEEKEKLIKERSSIYLEICKIKGTFN